MLELGPSGFGLLLVDWKLIAQIASQGRRSLEEVFPFVTRGPVTWVVAEQPRCSCLIRLFEAGVPAVLYRNTYCITRNTVLSYMQSPNSRQLAASHQAGNLQAISIHRALDKDI